MSSFRDTSSWQLVNGTTLSYSYQHQGEQRTSTSEKRPTLLYAQMSRLSLHRDIWWERNNPEKPEIKAGYTGREYVSGLARLINAHLYAITLDEIPNTHFREIFVNIFPNDEAELVQTSVADTWIYTADPKAPEEGWLKDELGQINFHSAGEYHEKSEVYATLYLSHDRFRDLADAIAANNIRSANIEILGDLFGLDYEGFFSDLNTTYNYAMLCEDKGVSAFGTAKGSSGRVKARLQGLKLEWSPNLDTRNVRERDEPKHSIYSEASVTEIVEPEQSNTNEQLVRVLNSMRDKIDQLHSALVLGLVVFAAATLVEWLRG